MAGQAGTGPVAVLGGGGTMGLPIARRIVGSGMPVRAWNRSADKAAPLAADGCEVAASPAEAARGAGIVLTMLADADAVLAVMNGPDGALDAMVSPAVWVQMSTIGEAGTRLCARLAEQRGLPFVDAPVLGTRQPAEQGALVVLASGPGEVRDRVQPVFDAVGQRTLWLGAAGAGTRLKLVVNTWVLAVVEAGAEIIALAEALGVQPGLFFDAIEGGALDLPYLRLKARAMTERNFEPAFSLRLAAKDASLAAQAAANRDLDLPLLRTIAGRLEQGAQRYGDADISATYLTSAAGPA
jgi:3-hydroxyisobutyrate dehydrogenase